MVWILGIFTLTGFNFTFWALMGFIRYLVEQLARRGFAVGRMLSDIAWRAQSQRLDIILTPSGANIRPEDIAVDIRALSSSQSEIAIDFQRVPLRNIRHEYVASHKLITEREVAAIVPAHNEESCIADTIRALKKVLPPENIFVGSDASTDRTVEIARGLGVNIADIWPNRGKARVLCYLLENYNLLEHYQAVMIVDADAEVSESYLKHALSFFDDPTVGAVAGHGVTRWKEPVWPPKWSHFFLAYRVRLWRLVQWGMRYGQNWKYFNATFIIPGSPSIYRTSALRHLEIDAPGLIIEDFNMTFEFQKKRLGRVAYDPGVFGVHHDPYTFRDYAKQIRRWNLGFWQTVKRHGIWPSFFWLFTGAFIAELLLYSVLVVSLPLLLLWFFITGFQPFPMPLGGAFTVAKELTFFDLVLGVFVVDYLMTVVAAAFERKPILLLYGPAFFFLRYVDAAVYLYTIPLAFFGKSSSGRWASPVRKA